MHWTRICIAAGLLAFAAQTAEAATPPRTMDLEILANGRLLLRGELIDGPDALEAKLRIMREQEPPFELRLRLPKTLNIDISAVMKAVQGLGLPLRLGERAPPQPVPAGIEASTI